MKIIHKIKRILTDFKCTIHNYGFKKSVCSLYEDLFHNHDRILLSPIDLMIPVNGEITAAQLIIISRYIDYERILVGEKTIWDKRFSELELGNNQWTEEDETYYFKLIQSLDTWGWDYNISSVYINKTPLYAYNGTHRLAYALKRNPYQVIPFTAFYTGWKWAGASGCQYWMEKGLTKYEFDILNTKYNDFLNNIDKSLYIIMLKENYKGFIKDENVHLEELIEGKIVKEVKEDYGYSKRLCSLLHSYYNHPFIVIRFSVNKQLLQINNHRINAPYIENYIRKYKTTHIYYTPTITEANQFRIIMSQYFKESYKDLLRS